MVLDTRADGREGVEVCRLCYFKLAYTRPKPKPAVDEDVGVDSQTNVHSFVLIESAAMDPQRSRHIIDPT